MKRRLRIFLFSALGLLLAVMVGLSLSSQSRFISFCDRFFAEELSSNALTLHYTVAEPENYDIQCEDISLGSYSTDSSPSKRRLLGKRLSLMFIAEGMLSEDLQRTYNLINHCLETEMDGLEHLLLQEPLVPSIGIQSQLPVLLAEYTFESEEDVQDYLTLLSTLPEYFDSLMALEEEKCENRLFMDPESAGELIGYCEEFLSTPENHFLVKTFMERLEPLLLSPEKNTLYIEENASALEQFVFPSYEKLKDFLIENQDTGSNVNGLSYFREGTDYYAWLLRSEVGCDRSFEEIETILDQALKADAAVIMELTNQNPKLLETRHDVRMDTSNPAGLTSYLAKRTTHDFPKIPKVHFEICDVPASMEEHLSPAFYLVPAIDRWEENVVYLNYGCLTEGVPLFTTLAHESYPGHLYQTVYENAKNPHPIHRLLYFGGYTEGWATYAEQLSYYYAPISGDMATLLSTSRAMTLNLYSHLDLYIHAYGWTEEDCRDYLKKFGITGSASIHDMFMLVKQQPANYLKYYLGYLEICMLRDKAKEVLGENFDLKEFHTFVLDYGPAPFELLEIYFEQWLQRCFLETH